MLTLRLLGGISLEAASGPVSGRAAQRRQLALLALLAAAQQKGCTRDRLIGFLWPEIPDDHARHHLSDSLYILRRALGEEFVFATGEVVRLNPAIISTDIGGFEDALRRGDLEGAANHYAGSFLDGFHFGDAGAFEEWVESERQRLALLYAEALESLAETAEEAGDYARATRWWQRLAVYDPLNTRVAVRFVWALAVAGDRANALQHAAKHQQRLQEELGIEPEEALTRLVKRLRRESVPHRAQPPGHAPIPTLPEFEEVVVKALAGSNAPPRPWTRRRAVGHVAIAAVALISAYVVFSQFRADPVGVVESDLPRLAVLPLENLGAPEDDYFAHGISEEITSRVAQISGLRVISRQSAKQYRNSDKTLQQIGEELGVAYVLQGSIRTDRTPEGSGWVRVTPQLIRISDNTHLWTDRYTVELVPGEIFRVQAEIAERVAGALDVKLSQEEREALDVRPTENLEAYDFYLRGIDYAPSHLRQRLQAAVQLFQRALDLDSNLAAAHALLSIVHSTIWGYHYDRSEARLFMAREAVDRALSISPTLPEAHEALGWLLYLGHLEYDSALAEFAIAFESQPNNARLLDGIGSAYRRKGDMAQALIYFQKAVEVDPRSAIAAHELAWTYVPMHEAREAARQFDRSISLRPDWASPYRGMAKYVCLRLEGDTEGARAALEEAERFGIELRPFIDSWITLETLDRNYQAALDRLALVGSEVMSDGQFTYEPTAQRYGLVYLLMGQQQLAEAYFDSARTILEANVLERPEDSRYRSALGITYAGLGRREDAIREGELAVELLPPSKEALVGSYRVEQLARIYTMVGEYDAAIEQLEILLTLPSLIGAPMLRIDPTWESLRDHPRFQQLVAGPD